MSTLAAIYSSMRVQWRLTQARSIMKYILWIQPLLFSALGALMLKSKGAVGVEYAVVGSGLISLWASIVWSGATNIVQERWMGNLEYLLIAPVSLFWSSLGKNLGNVLMGLIGTGTAFLYSKYLFGVPVTISEPGWLFLGLLTTIFSFLALSLCMAALVIFSRQSVSLLNGMTYPIYILGGLMFPLDLLPRWTTPLSHIIPLMWARQALGAALTGGDGGRFWTALIWMLGLGLAYWLLAYRLYGIVDRKIREEGELA